MKRTNIFSKKKGRPKSSQKTKQQFLKERSQRLSYLKKGNWHKLNPHFHPSDSIHNDLLFQMNPKLYCQRQKVLFDQGDQQLKRLHPNVYSGRECGRGFNPLAMAAISAEPKLANQFRSMVHIEKNYFPKVIRSVPHWGQIVMNPHQLFKRSGDIGGLSFKESNALSNIKHINEINMYHKETADYITAVLDSNRHSLLEEKARDIISKHQDNFEQLQGKVYLTFNESPLKEYNSKRNNGDYDLIQITDEDEEEKAYDVFFLTHTPKNTVTILKSTTEPVTYWYYNNGVIDQPEGYYNIETDKPLMKMTMKLKDDKRGRPKGSKTNKDPRKKIIDYSGVYMGISLEPEQGESLLQYVNRLIHLYYNRPIQLTNPAKAEKYLLNIARGL